MAHLQSVPPLRARAGYLLHPGALGLRAHVATIDAPVDVRRLSLHDGEMAFRDGESPLERGALFALHLDSTLLTEAPLVLRGRCRGVRYEGGRTWVVFEHSPSREDARALHRMLETLQRSNQAHSDFRICAPLRELEGPRGRLAKLLESMVLLHRELRVHAKDGSHIPSSHLRERSRWPSCGFTVDVRAPRADYVFDVGPAPTDESPREIRLLRTAMRSESRAAAPPRTSLAIEHRLLGGAVSLQVEAMSRRTLVVVRNPEMLLYPGMELPASELRWKGGSLELDLVVGDPFEDPVHGHCQEIRVRLESRDIDQWRTQVDRVCHPHAKLHAGDPGELWDLYDRSGYLNISDKEAEHFEHLRSSFVRAADILVAHPELGAQLTWRSIDGLDGSVTFLNAWERSALIYQLARGPERPLWMSGSRPLYDLYLRATEHVLRHGAEWIVVFVQHAGARFSKAVNRDFPLRHADGRRSHVSSFRAWEVETLLVDSVEGSGVTCSDPTDRELKVWLADLALRRPHPYLAGYDLVPRRARLREPQARFTRAGASRQRIFRMARVNGAPVAMAWIESVADGFHLFGLLDSIRIDCFAPMSAATEAAVRAALIAEAQRHLAALGKRKVIFFDEAMGPAPVSCAVNLGDADQALYSTELVPELIEEVAMAVGGNGS